MKQLYQPTNQVRWCFIIFLFFNLTAFAQVEYEEPCGFVSEDINLHRPASSPCEPSPPYSGSIDPNVLATYPPVSYNLQIWINNRTDGTNEKDYTFEQIKGKIETLNQQFSLANICLSLVAIDTLNYSPTYGDPQDTNNHGLFQSWAVGQGHENVNALNLYVYQGHGRGSAGGTNANININSFLDDSGIIGHEVGHLFNLRHTHGSGGKQSATWRTPNCESVTRNPQDPAFNAFCKGDQVLDTNAVPDLRYEQQYEKIDSLIINHGYTFSQAELEVNTIIGYQFNAYLDPVTMAYIGDGEDCNGTPYTITPADATNLMAYADWKKMDHFSIGQAIRMREYIEDKPSKFNPITNTEGVDLMIANSLNDIGAEPDIHSNMILWRSPDIWVRNQADGFTIQENQNPEYDPNNPVYVYVKIRNKSCQDFVATPIDTLKLHWAKASTSSGWPTLWDGSTSNPTLGAPINAVNLPNIAAGESEIVEFEWYPPNPADFESISNDPWHFCLLARILSPQDPIL